MFDSNIILDYKRHNYDETLTPKISSSESKCVRPNHANDPLDFHRSRCLNRNVTVNEKKEGSSKKDVFIGTLSVDEFSHDCTGSIANTTKSATEVDSCIERRSSSSPPSAPTSSKLDTSISLCTELNSTAGTCIGIESRTGIENSRSIRPCSRTILNNDAIGQLNVGVGHRCAVEYEPEEPTKTQGSTEECFIKEQTIHCDVGLEHKNDGSEKGANFKVKYLDKEAEIDVDTDEHGSGSSLDNNEPATILAATDVTVGSNLQFLNTGDSIVVLTQDVNSIGLPNNMVSSTKSGLGSMQFSSMSISMHQI